MKRRAKVARRGLHKREICHVLYLIKCFVSQTHRSNEWKWKKNTLGENSTFPEVKKEKENTVTECRTNFFQSFLRKACIYPFLIYPCETTTHSWKHSIGPRIGGEAKWRSSWTEPSPVLLDYFTLILIPTILNLARVESRVFPRTELISEISPN